MGQRGPILGEDAVRLLSVPDVLGEEGDADVSVRDVLLHDDVALLELEVEVPPTLRVDRALERRLDGAEGSGDVLCEAAENGRAQVHFP